MKLSSRCTSKQTPQITDVRAALTADENTCCDITFLGSGQDCLKVSARGECSSAEFAFERLISDCFGNKLQVKMAESEGKGPAQHMGELVYLAWCLGRTATCEQTRGFNYCEP